MGAVPKVANIACRCAVNLCSVHVESAFTWLYTASTREVLYMVRRRRYVIVLAVRRQQAIGQDEAPAIMQVCPREQDGMRRVVRDVGATKAFYEDLSRLVEYLHYRAGEGVSTRARQALLGASRVR